MQVGAKLEPALACKPAGEPRDSVAPAPRSRKVERTFRHVRVGDVPALVALAPIFEPKCDLAAGDTADFVNQLEQADRILRTAAEIEGTACHAFDIRERTNI